MKFLGIQPSLTNFFNSKSKIFWLYQSGLRRTSTSSPSWIFKLFPSWDPCSVSLKSRTSVTTLGTRTKASKIQDDEDVAVLRSPDINIGDVC